MKLKDFIYKLDNIKIISISDKKYDEYISGDELDGLGCSFETECDLNVF